MENLKGARPTVLIVDDMATNLEVLASLLKDDYHVKVAKSGPKALEIANAQDKPDLILLDIEMPNMDGYEVCRQLKNNALTSSIPIIFLTVRNSEKDEAIGLHLGAVDFISKPYNSTIVKIRVRNHIALKLKSDRLEELSLMDGLTNIPNRRYFNNIYDKYYKEACRESQTLFVVMMDVDDFKAYNDHYGHGKGDECLIKIAATLKRHLKRPFDVIARYGGEEFVILLKEVEDTGALKVVQELIDSVHKLHIKHQFSSACQYVTISAGISKNKPGLTQEGLLKKADDALYQAKKDKKNQFIYS